MKQSNIKVFAKSKAEVVADCIEWAEEIEKDYSPDLIVFIAKSGFLFAKPIADYFGCPMVDITVYRPLNSSKDTIKKFVPWIPQWLLFILLRSKGNYDYQEKNSEREVELSDRFKNLDWERFKRILILDDSTDTGWSLIAAKEEIKKRILGEVRTASYCVIDLSKDRVNVEYSRYKNTIIVTATSRYSREHKVFKKELKEWMAASGNE